MNTSDDFVDSTIANLKVIGMIPQSGRLCVRKGQLCVDADDNVRSVRRWLRGDSRELALMHVRNTVQNAGRIVAILGVDRSCWAIDRIADELAQCDVGLQNLRTTYIDDSITVANLAVVIERIRELLGRLGLRS